VIFYSIMLLLAIVICGKQDIICLNKNEKMKINLNGKFTWDAKKIIIFSIFSLLAFLVIVFFLIRQTVTTKSIAKVKDVYYERYSNIELSGKIVKKISIDNDRYSTYYIKISKSNTNSHDLTDSVGDYFLVVNGDVAKMVYAMSYDIAVDDSLNINYKNKEMLIYRNNKLIKMYPLPSFTDYYLSMQEKGINLK